MSNTRPSLLERAAEIYDFGSGLPVRAPILDELPPPRPRPKPVPVQPSAEPQAKLEPAPGPERPKSREAARPAPHRRAELDFSALAASGLLTPDAPATNLAEEMRLIKRRLLTAVDQRAEQGDDSARIVLVASGQPGDGKTFIAANLALSIASEQERSVLLVDGDSAKADLIARLGLEEGPGLVDALIDAGLDPDGLVVDTNVEGLSVLPAGRRERNIPELLASARTGEVLNRLLSADPRRIIVIDSPPALASSTAAALAARAGHALIVVRADRTSEADINETVDLLSACPSLSLVLNSTAFQVGGRRFGKYEEYR